LHYIEDKKQIADGIDTVNKTGVTAIGESSKVKHQRDEIYHNQDNMVASNPESLHRHRNHAVMIEHSTSISSHCRPAPVVLCC